MSTHIVPGFQSIFSHNFVLAAFKPPAAYGLDGSSVLKVAVCYEL